MKEKNRVDLDRKGGGEETKGVEGGEATIRKYYVRKSLFSTKGKEVLSLSMD